MGPRSGTLSRSAAALASDVAAATARRAACEGVETEIARHEGKRRKAIPYRLPDAPSTSSEGMTGALGISHTSAHACCMTYEGVNWGDTAHHVHTTSDNNGSGWHGPWKKSLLKKEGVVHFP